MAMLFAAAAVAAIPAIVRGDYSAALGPSLQRNDTMRAWGSRYARLILDRCDGNKREACRVLGISYHTLQAYLRFPLDEPAAMAAAGWPVTRPRAEAAESEAAACVGVADV